MVQRKDTWFGGLFRVAAATLSAGAALVSILNYTTARAVLTRAEEAPAEPDRVHRLSLVPAADTATALGDSLPLAAMITDDRGTALLGISPVWTSADPAVAEVDQAGTVVSRGPGVTAVIVRVGRLEARARIAVDPRPAGLRTGDTLLRVPEGERILALAEATDARGHPIPSVPVHWRAADPAVASVDSLGDVYGATPGRSTVTASAGELRADVAVEVVPVPASITVLGGEDQHAAAGRPLGTPVTAQIVSRTGRPIPGVVAAFQVRGPGGAAEPAVDTADARGVVSAVWTLDVVPGRQQLAVAVEGLAVSPVVSAEADPVPANTRVALGAELPPAVAGDSLAEPVVVRVTDSAGVALADLPVRWSTPDGGDLVPLGARTDSLGEARARWRLGPKAGRQRIRAQVGDPRTLPAFTAMTVAHPGRAESLVVRGGDGQSGKAGGMLKRPVVVRALDRSGNPVPGASIAATPLAGRLADSVIRTDSSGQARLVWTLGPAAGVQRLSIALTDGGGGLQVTARAAAPPPAKAAAATAPVKRRARTTSRPAL